MSNESLRKDISETILKLQIDTDTHGKYLAAAPSLEYHHYVVVVTGTTYGSVPSDWTVRMTDNGPQLQKLTRASDFYKFMTKKEAHDAGKKLRLVDSEGIPVDHKFEVISCREWHSRMIAWEKNSIAQLEEVLKLMDKEAA